MKRRAVAAAALVGILTVGSTIRQAYASGSTVELETGVEAATRDRIVTLGLGAAVTFVLTVTAPLNNLVYNYLLKEGALTWINPAWTGGTKVFVLL